MINFPFGTNGKLIILGVPILKHITVIISDAILCLACKAELNENSTKVVRHLKSNTHESLLLIAERHLITKILAN